MTQSYFLSCKLSTSFFGQGIRLKKPLPRVIWPLIKSINCCLVNFLLFVFRNPDPFPLPLPLLIVHTSFKNLSEGHYSTLSCGISPYKGFEAVDFSEDRFQKRIITSPTFDLQQHPDHLDLLLLKVGRKKGTKKMLKNESSRKWIMKGRNKWTKK